MKLDPVHRSLVAVDIEGYSRRQNLGQLELREALRRVLEDAFDGIGVEINPQDRQDQGDAFLILVKPEISKVLLVDGLVREIENALRRCNRYRMTEEKIRLRVALHAGEVHIDGTGFPSAATVAVARLIDAGQLKTALKAAEKDIVVIISDALYRDVVMHGYGAILPEEYSRVEVSVKEFRQPAWIRVPGRMGSGALPTETSATTDDNFNQQSETTMRPDRQGPVNYFHGPAAFDGGYAAGRNINIDRRKKRGK